jgi:hypothetical protein
MMINAALLDEEVEHVLQAGAEALASYGKMQARQVVRLRHPFWPLCMPAGQ